MPLILGSVTTLVFGASAATFSTSLSSTQEQVVCADITFGTSKYTSNSPAEEGDATAYGVNVRDISGQRAFAANGSAVRLGTVDGGGSLTIAFSGKVKILRAKVYAYRYNEDDSASLAFEAGDALFGERQLGMLQVSEPDISDDTHSTPLSFLSPTGEGISADSITLTSSDRLNVCKIVLALVEEPGTPDSTSSYYGDADGVSDIEIKILELGTYRAGDCIYVRAGGNDIVIDGGAHSSSASTVIPRLRELIPDGTIEYAVVTHAHEDHIALFAMSEGSILDTFQVKTLIDFAGSDSTSLQYARYENEKRELAGESYTVAECLEAGTTGTAGPNKVYTLGENLTMELLESDYYLDAPSENDYSVSLLFRQGNNKYLFMGDSEEIVEESVVANNDIGHCVFYKANHHGSSTSSSEALMAEITPTYIAVPCNAGCTQYTDAYQNTFPTQQSIDRWAPYTDKIMALGYDINDGSLDYESLNGEITVFSAGGNEEDVSMHGSVSDTYLPYSDWFSMTDGYGDGRPNRTWPEDGVRSDA